MRPKEGDVIVTGDGREGRNGQTKAEAYSPSAPVPLSELCLAAFPSRNNEEETAPTK